MPTNIPLTPVYGGNIALRSAPLTFPQDAEDQYTYLALFSTDWNTTITAMNTAIGEANVYANSASASASAASVSAGESATSAAISSSNANFVGKWENQTGSASIPYSVWDDGNNWQLLINIPDVTTSKPIDNPLEWAIIITPALTEPDVKISFNDGITMERGYGTVDANGNRAIDYTRASGSGNVNKSGVSETLAVNEAGITENGMSAYVAYTNEILWSEDLENTVWSQGDATITTGALGPDGLNTAFTLTSTSTSTAVGQLITSVIGDVFTGGFFMRRRSGIGTIKLRVGNNTQSTIEQPTDQWRFIGATGDALTSTTNRLYILMENIGDQIDVWGAQSTKTLFTAPYIKTTTAPASSAPVIATINAMNNLPAQGQPFTIQCVCNMFNADDFGVAWSARDAVNGVTASLTRNVGGTLYAAIKTTGGNFLTPTALHPAIDGIQKFIIVYTGSSLLMYADGILISSVAVTGTPIYELLGDVYIGFDGVDKRLNSETKDNFIWHSALSSAEIAALGGPK